MSVFNKILKNALANGTGFAVEAIIAICMLPFILNRIGDAAYGMWALTISLFGYMGVLQLGLRPAINKYVAQYNAHNKIGDIREIVHASLYIYIWCALIVSIITLLLAWNINTLFNIPAEFQSSAFVLTMLVGLQIAIGMIAIVYGGVISGLQRYEISNGIEIFVMLSRTVIILLFLTKYPHIYTIACAHFSMVFLGYFLTFYSAKKLVNLNDLMLLRKPSKKTLILIFSFSIITFFIGVLGSIMSYIDSIIIASMITVSAVTYYTIGSRMVKYCQNLVVVLMSVLAPAVSDLYAKGDTNIGPLYIYASKVTSMTVFPILLFFIIQGVDFLQLWVDENYNIISYYVMLILSIGGFLILPQKCTNPILFGTAKHKLILWVSIAEGIVSVFLSILLCHYYGVLGIAVGLTLPKMLIGSIIFPVYICRLLKINIMQIFWQSYVRPAIVSMPLAVILCYAKNKGLIDSWYILIIEVFMCIFVQAVSVLILGMNKNERLKFKKTLIPKRFIKA